MGMALLRRRCRVSDNHEKKTASRNLELDQAYSGRKSFWSEGREEQMRGEMGCTACGQGCHPRST